MKKSYRRIPQSLATYQALRHQKQQLAKSQTDSIQVRFKNFQELLKVSSVDKICNKYISKSALQLQQAKQSPIVQQQFDTQDTVLKKFDKMVTGIEKYDEQNNNKAKKNLRTQQTEQAASILKRKSTNNRIKSAINIESLKTTKKTQKQYHNMLSLKQSIQKNQLFLKIPYHEISARSNKFQNLKKKINQLQKKAKNKYGLIFTNKTAKVDQQHQEEMEEIAQKQKYINSLYVKHSYTSQSQYKEIVNDMIQSKVEDSTVPLNLLINYRKQKKSTTRDCIRRYIYPSQEINYSKKRYVKIL